MKDKKIKIHNLTEKLLNDSYVAMQQNIYKAINSGALDIESWDESIDSMIIPAIIIIAILEDEAEHQKSYSLRNNKHTKQIKGEVKNLKHFL